jgi:hypothetical protein
LEGDLGESKRDERVVCKKRGKDALKRGLGKGAARKDQGLQVAIGCKEYEVTRDRLSRLSSGALWRHCPLHGYE